MHEAEFRRIQESMKRQKGADEKPAIARARKVRHEPVGTEPREPESDESPEEGPDEG